MVDLEALAERRANWLTTTLEESDTDMDSLITEIKRLRGELCRYLHRHHAALRELGAGHRANFVTCPDCAKAHAALLGARSEAMGEPLDLEATRKRAKAAAGQLYGTAYDHAGRSLSTDIPALCDEVERLTAIIRALWDAYAPEDYLEGEDSDYGPMVLAQRKAWQLARDALSPEPAKEQSNG